MIVKLFRKTVHFITNACLVTFSVGLALLTIFGFLWAFFDWIQN